MTITVRYAAAHPAGDHTVDDDHAYVMGWGGGRDLVDWATDNDCGLPGKHRSLGLHEPTGSPSKYDVRNVDVAF